MSIEERFWNKVDRCGPDECWEWLADKELKGYGRFKVAGRVIKAHRFAWELENGEVPKDLCVLHKCDVPSCVNPAHLFLGTRGDNNRDCIRKGRGGSQTHPELLPRGDQHWTRLYPEKVPRGDRSGARLHPERLARGDQSGARLHPERLARGENNGNSKLTENQVVEIRTRFTAGELQRVLAEEFGVSDGHVSKIVRENSWAHVSKEALSE